MSSKRAPPLPQPTLDDLSDELQLRVLCYLPPAQRPSLALVCKRWRGLCEGAGPLWVDLFIHFRHVYNSSYLYKWLLPRRACVRGLIIITETEEDWLAAHLVLGLVAAGLERLVVRAGREGLGMGSTEWLGVLTQLKSLQLAYDRDTLVQEAAFPPGLEALVLRPVSIWAVCKTAPPGLATAAALTKLQLCQVRMDDEANDSEQNGWCPLLHLTALQRLVIRHSKLACLPDGMAALTRLLSLSLTQCEGSPCFDQPEGLAPLTALKSLSLLDLSCCTLFELPPAVATLPALRTLLVSHNRLGGGLPEGPYLASLEAVDLSLNELKALPEALLSCSRLETADLRSAVDRSKSQPAAAAQYLRQLLTANPHMRELKFSSSTLPASQLAKLQTAFPGVRLLELDPCAFGPRGGDAGDGGSPLLGSASSSSDDEEWDEEEEDSEEEDGESSGWEAAEGGSGVEEGEEEEGLDYPGSSAGEEEAADGSVEEEE